METLCKYNNKASMDLGVKCTFLKGQTMYHIY